jgi:pyrroline-5-carboxylate reductase
VTSSPISIGIIGGSGMLGSAIARAILEGGAATPETLWISNRSGSSAGFEDWPGIRFTTNNQSLVDACDVVLLSVPPALVDDLGISAPDRLVMSVMAGVTIAEISALTGARRIVRAMSSPAAALGLAYSPFVASADVTDADRAVAKRMFEACGKTDEVADEGQIDFFTALTGPVPGFVAYFAECMVDSAIRQGVAPEIADRAVRQLFHASGVAMAESKATPAEHVREMIDYAGTTAAGLNAMQASPLARAIAEGLDAACSAARRMRS